MPEDHERCRNEACGHAYLEHSTFLSDCTVAGCPCVLFEGADERG